MFIHILIGLKKTDKANVIHNEYIRVLGFNNVGKEYLRKIKKTSILPIVTDLKKQNSIIKDYEIKEYTIYNMLVDEDVLDYELSNKPIKKIS